MAYFDPFMVGVEQAEGVTTLTLIQRIGRRIKKAIRRRKHKKVSLNFIATGKTINSITRTVDLYGLTKVGYRKLIFNLTGEKNYKLLMELLGSDDDE